MQPERSSYYQNLPTKETNRAALKFFGGLALVIIGLISLGELLVFSHYGTGRFSDASLLLACLAAGSIAGLGVIVAWRVTAALAREVK